MGTAIRRVVTGRDIGDISYFTSVETVEPVTVGGMHVVNLWGTGDEGARVGNDPAETPQLFPFFPDGSGHGDRCSCDHRERAAAPRGSGSVLLRSTHSVTPSSSRCPPRTADLRRAAEAA